jgi:hypothetical protein
MLWCLSFLVDALVEADDLTGADALQPESAAASPALAR